MRAQIVLDPHHGAGYGIIKIYDAAETADPRIVIKRLSDGNFLSSGGWRQEQESLAPLRWESRNAVLFLWFGPDVIDDLDTDERYELTLPGSGSCPLFPEDIRQSTIIDDAGAGTYAPPPENVETPPQVTDGESIIREGVENDAQVIPDMEDTGLPSGVTAGPAGATPDKQPKKFGCLTLCIILCFVWIGGGFYLWHAAREAPVSRKDLSFSIEIIPKSTESSVADDPGDEEAEDSGEKK